MMCRGIKTGGVVLAVIIVWLIGFCFFCNQVFEYLHQPVRRFGQEKVGLVVLTGGRNRIARAIELLNAGYGERLLISGVTPGVTLEMILDREDVRQKNALPIDLGYQARDTVGNAAEIQTWAAQFGYTALQAVTSFYHIPRSRLELERQMPQVEVAFVAVDTPYVLPQWWKNFKTFCFLAMEYFKFLIVWVQYKVLGL